MSDSNTSVEVSVRPAASAQQWLRSSGSGRGDLLYELYDLLHDLLHDLPLTTKLIHDR